jgi:trk system potassium uptake protein TrkA
LKIIILGAGHTGSSVTKRLANEGHDVVVIDTNPSLLRELQDRVDVSTVVGNGTRPDTLERANIAKADIFITVMSRDEDNMVACQIAWSLYQLPMKIARIRSTDYLNHPELFSQQHIPVDLVITPEILVTDYLQHLLELPGANLVRDFADGSARLVSVTVQEVAKSIGLSIHDLHIAHPIVRYIAIYRDGSLFIPDTETIIQARDRVYYIAPPALTVEIMELMRESERPYKRLILAGGGHIGKRLALALEHRFKIKIIEKSAERAALIAPQLEKAIVLNADTTDHDFLVDEGIGETDVFCAITSDDEANILSGMLAKRMGARKTMCLVNKPAYVDMMRDGFIDIAFSPDKITAGSILHYARCGQVERVYPIHESGAELIEVVATGEEGESKLVGWRVDTIEMPDGVILGAIVRDGEMIDIHGHVEIMQGDHLVLFLRKKSLINAVTNCLQSE